MSSNSKSHCRWCGYTKIPHLNLVLWCSQDILQCVTVNEYWHFGRECQVCGVADVPSSGVLRQAGFALCDKKVTKGLEEEEAQ